MEPEQWRRIEDLFLRALEQEEGARAAYLHEHCGGDVQLRQEVERMLGMEKRGAARLAVAVGGAVRSLTTGIPAGSQLGPYRVLQPIGEGGMGIVYRARRSDDVFQKEVAIKVVRRGMDTEAILRRFQQERRILASLEHPNIARVLDGGSTEDGLPYLVMEYVDGQPLTTYLEQRRSGLRERLELFLKVCKAVEHAHRNLIVHRDLKPTNILVDHQGEPHLLDFGVAKLLDESAMVLTTGPQAMFTPAYASPEQVKGEPITVASDVYSLGIVLYEVLTGTMAYDLTGLTPMAALRTVAEEEPRPPSQAARAAKEAGEAAPVSAEKLRGDLDRIVLMALEKNPAQRYGSVEQLAGDIRSFLESRPVRARPQTVRYRALKFARRYRGFLAATAVVLLSLIGGIAYATYQAHRAQARFEQVRKLANTFVFDVHDAIQPLPGSTKARQLLVSTGLQYLDSLASEASDPDLQWELAQAYIKLGNVQGATRVGPHLGDAEGALASHRKATRLLNALSQRSPNDLKVLRALAGSLQATGDLEAGAGRPEEALAVYQRTLETAQAIVAHPQHETGDLRLHALAHSRIADQQYEYGAAEDALRSYQAALQSWRRYAEGSPFEVGRRGVAYGLQHLAKAYGGRGDAELAIQTYQEAVRLREELVARDPGSLPPRRELAVAYHVLGNQLASPFEFSIGDRSQALVVYSKALDIFEELAAADPNDFRAQRDLCMALIKRGRMLAPDDPHTALRLVKRAETISKKLAQAEPSNVDVQRVRGEALFELGFRLRALGRLPEAIESAEEALRRIAPLAPKQMGARRELIDGHQQLGDFRLQARQPDMARVHFDKAIQLASELQAQLPGNLFALSEVAESYEGLGRVEQHIASDSRTPPGQRAAACLQSRGWFEKSLRTWETWEGKGGVGTYPKGRKRRIAAEMPTCR